MGDANGTIIDSHLKKKKTDWTGSPLGVARLNADKSYSDIGVLLQEYINENNQGAWEKIKAKIDYTYKGVDVVLSSLQKETGFDKEVKSRVEDGKKLLFKPNLMNPAIIHPQTHGPDLGGTACTEWPFIAGLMKWFHDKIGVRYHQMALGEAGSMVATVARQYSILNPERKTITPEAVMEGKSCDFYGGWGFYFVRKYLSESLGVDNGDDPMKGYEESVLGIYIPPGNASDKLMIYDLNRISDDPTKGRNCEVPDGVNYKSIVLHKVVAGGNPEDHEDVKVYPGCVLVNVPKLKVHFNMIITNAIKNLGIGLYPMQHASSGSYKWEYSIPHNTPVPALKGGLPHQVWNPEMDHETGMPKRDEKGNYIVKRTGGLNATMLDAFKALDNQSIFMIHVVDGIETINIDHMGIGMGQKSPEGIVLAGLDPVATDTLSARYMFCNVPLNEALEVELAGGTAGSFPQKVPIPTLQGNDIVSKVGFDCPLSRDMCFKTAEKRGLGQMEYYVGGNDLVTDSPIVSIQGHLGALKNGEFSGIITNTLFFNAFSFPWDLQKTAFKYMEAVDKIEGTSMKENFLDDYDEDGDGVVTYEDHGKTGVFGVHLHLAGDMITEMGTEELGYLRGNFNLFSRMYKASNKHFNAHGHDAMKHFFIAFTLSVAFQISQSEIESPDPFLPGLVFGKGKWPSFQFANFIQTGVMLYGQGFPNGIEFPSLYTLALFYADLTQNEGKYAGNIINQPDPEAPNRYVSDTSNGKMKPLDFMFYVPVGFDNLSGRKMPNVEATDDPAKVFTADFAGGKESWPGKKLLGI